MRRCGTWRPHLLFLSYLIANVFLFELVFTGLLGFGTFAASCLIVCTCPAISIFASLATPVFEATEYATVEPVLELRMEVIATHEALDVALTGAAEQDPVI